MSMKIDSSSHGHPLKINGNTEEALGMLRLVFP